MNRQERQAYIKKMNTERDRINQWEFAMEQAKTKGMAEEKMTIAKSMKLEGISVDIICKCTGLSIEEIENL